jgi:hypothetical protein
VFNVRGGCSNVHELTEVSRYRQQLCSCLVELDGLYGFNAYQSVQMRGRSTFGLLTKVSPMLPLILTE